MKFIRYTAPDGTKADCCPVPNARLVTFLDGDGQKVICPLFMLDRRADPPLPEGVEFAETEEQFVTRIAAKDLPPGATDMEIMEAQNAL